MALIKLDTCKVKTKLPQTFFSEATGEVTITAEQHGLTRMPYVAVYDTAGHEIEVEVEVNETTFEVKVRQESPAIPIYIALN
jgi:YbbR domain-containing protein